MKEKELEISRLSIGCVPKQTFVFLRNIVIVNIKNLYAWKKYSYPGNLFIFEVGMGRRICLSKPCFLLWDSQASFSYLSHMKTNPLTLYVALRLVLFR